MKYFLLLFLFPFFVLADEPQPFYNETAYTITCNAATLAGQPNYTFLIFGDVGSDYENIGLEGQCGDTIVLNDSFIAGIYSYSEYSNNGSVLHYDVLFNVLPGAQPVPQPDNIFGAGGLMGTSTNLLASVAAGVTDTGVNLWPLFTLLGVILAFIIAGKVRDFIMEMGTEERRKRQYISDLANSTNDQKDFDIINKYKKGKRG